MVIAYSTTSKRVIVKVNKVVTGVEEIYLSRSVSLTSYCKLM
jgi:hypothetical protein